MLWDDVTSLEKQLAELDEKANEAEVRCDAPLHVAWIRVRDIMLLRVDKHQRFASVNRKSPQRGQVGLED